MGAETDIYKVSIDDAINFDKRENEIFATVFKELNKEKITKDFQNSDNKYSKILVYILDNHEPKIIYKSQEDSGIVEIRRICELVEEKEIKNYVFIVGVYESDYRKNNIKLTEEQKMMKEELIKNSNQKIKSIREEFWKFIKEKKNQKPRTS